MKGDPLLSGVPWCALERTYIHLTRCIHISSVSVLSLVVVVVCKLKPKPRSLFGRTSIPLLAIERFQSLCIVRVIGFHHGGHLGKGMESDYLVSYEGRSRDMDVTWKLVG